MFTGYVPPDAKPVAILEIVMRIPSRHRRRFLSALAVVTLLGSAAIATPSAIAGVPDSPGLPPTFAGIVVDGAFAAPLPEQRATLAAVRRSGVTLVRRTFDWAEIEHPPGVLYFRL